VASGPDEKKTRLLSGKLIRSWGAWADEYRHPVQRAGSDPYLAASGPYLAGSGRYLGPWPWISSACWNVGRLTHSIRGWLITPIGRNWIESEHIWSPAAHTPSAG